MQMMRSIWVKRHGLGLDVLRPLSFLLSHWVRLCPEHLSSFSGLDSVLPAQQLANRAQGPWQGRAPHLNQLYILFSWSQPAYFMRTEDIL